jgi:hypothetical protein
MFRDLTIIHIEDEFREFLSLVTTIKTMIEDLWETEGNQQTFAEVKVIASSGDPVMNWIVYEIIADARPTQKFRYIFVKDTKMPAEITQFLVGERVFVLDILRPIAGQSSLGVSVEESMASINEHLVSTDNVVLFTAYQGTGLDHLGKSVPKKISKEDEDGLEQFLGGFVRRLFSHG